MNCKNSILYQSGYNLEVIPNYWFEYLHFLIQIYQQSYSVESSELGFEFLSDYLKVKTHCLYLVLNTKKTSHFYWRQFWDKNDGKHIGHWNYFQIPRALSELPANSPGWFSQKGKMIKTSIWANLSCISIASLLI